MSTVETESANDIHVSLHVEGGQTYAGLIPVHDVVHLALDKLLPTAILHNHRISVYKDGTLIYPDMFLYEIVAHYGDANFIVVATTLELNRPGTFTNYGIDHLALAVEDRPAARRFFADGLRFQTVRDDDHLTVVTSGNSALFLFDWNPNAPLAPQDSSRIHHLGFVVDDLEAAASHLRENFPNFIADFTLLEREERWSLYGHVEIGSIRFLIQLSQIKPAFRGLTTRSALESVDVLYDYASKEYGVRLG